MQCYEVALWLHWPVQLLACSEIPTYAEWVEAYSHFDAAQCVMRKYSLKCVAHAAVEYHGKVIRWSFLRRVERSEEV